MDIKTHRLWKIVDKEIPESERPTLPNNFIDGLRLCLEAGLSCDEIVASLILFTGYLESIHKMRGRDVIEKAVSLVKIMQHDIKLIQVEDCFFIKGSKKGV